MNSQWNLALIISLLFHTAIIVEAPAIFKKKISIIQKEKEKQIEIVPKKIEKIKEIAKHEKLELESPKPLPYVDNILTKLIEKNTFSNLQKTQISQTALEKVSFSDVPTEKELKKNPAYMSYYRLIREKIRANTYQNYNTNRKGEILVDFLVLKSGDLEAVRLDPSSTSNKILREIALKSIKEAAPFPSFPDELKKYSHLKFTISIYFKNN